MILRLRVQILPLSLGEKMAKSHLLLGHSSSTVVEWLTQYHDTKCSNPASVIKREIENDKNVIHYWANSSSTVVNWQAHNPKIEGLNPATVTRRENGKRYLPLGQQW
jgi:hypothetical protein